MNPASDDEIPIRSGGGRSPLFWILVPAMAGIFCARIFSVNHPIAFSLSGLAFSSAAIALSLKKSQWRFDEGTWALATLLSGFLLFWAYGSLRMRDKEKWCDGLPFREVTMDMKIETSYPPDQWERQRGIAIIVSAPEIQGYLVGQKVLFRVNDEFPVRTDATVRVKGLVQRLPCNFPEYDSAHADSFRHWLAGREIYFEFKRGHVVGEIAPPSAFFKAMKKARGWMRRKLFEGSDKMPEIRAIVPAMLLGEKSLLSPEEKDLFRMTGMMHLFAVSGLHVGLVALILEITLAAMRIGRRTRIVASLCALLGYVLVIGAPPSAVRAFLMIAFYRIGTLTGRPAKGLPSLVASAIAVLVYDPAQLFDAGARLSYGIVASIILYGIPLGNLLREKLPLYDDLPRISRKRRHRFMLAARDRIADTIGVTFGAFAIAAPLSIQYFGIFSPGSVLLNILMIPVALLSATAAVLCTLVSVVALIPGLAWISTVGTFFNFAGWTCAWEMKELVETISGIPFLFFKIGYPTSWCGTFATVAILTLTVLLRSKEVRDNLTWMLVPTIALAGTVALAAL